MCRMSSSQYERYRRTQSEGGRSLLAWLRELWSRPRPKPAAAGAEVVPFPVEAARRADPKAERGGPKAA
jgi:hypothetical protein